MHADKLTSKSGKLYERVYDCRKPVKQYYIYFHDALLGGPCYLKISSYLPFHAEFYFNGHNAIQLQLDKQDIQYRLKDNVFVDVESPEALQSMLPMQNDKWSRFGAEWLKGNPSPIEKVFSIFEEHTE